MRTDKRMARIEEVLSRRQPDLTVVMENIHDPHNVSAMFRSCDAAGALKAHLVYSTGKFPDIGKKSSASARKWVERVKHRSIEECYAALRTEGFTIYATRLDANARSLYDLDLRPPSAFVFGNEHRGVSDEAASQADACVMIPMMGMIQSLNVSVACAVTLFEVVRQRTLAGQFENSKLGTAELKEMMKKWALRK
ncbi:MAG: RNA methyltransferase [Ignavibacteria bacterium RIFCSPLOWO2_12_FULL_56_21]|nr:MAG: RNA methyltransferase [Ignavibacteria bacterium RIFCSPLOWO2_12_FULL_56_21]